MTQISGDRLSHLLGECASPGFNFALAAAVGLAGFHSVGLGLVAGARLAGGESTLGLHRRHDDATIGEAGDDLAVIAMPLAVCHRRPVGIPRISFTESVTIGGALRAVSNGAIRDR